MGKYTVVYMYDIILLITREEWIIEIWNNMNQSKIIMLSKRDQAC